MIELLAPAGNTESFVTAIKNGANAIYLGAKNFNARSKIENFNLEELQKLVSYAHLYDVKVYLTLNTLISDSEINDVLNVIYESNRAGVDAFIIQDLGIASLLKKIYPGIELHASTQMGIHNLEGAIVAQRSGIKRVVLSRETPLSEIKRIKENTSLEIEYFVQGALCVCFSGNCYLSAKLFNESGNRGRCLQPCRLLYTLKDNGKIINTKYYLSSKDFCMAGRIKDLIDAGVTSFKIEGRARRSGYVALVTNVYRNLLDGKPLTKEMQDNIKLGFNRGNYCEGYFNGNGSIIYNDIQNNLGLKIGKVVAFQKGNKFNTMAISSDREIGKGDVLKFLRNGKEVASISAIDVKPIKNYYYITTTNQVLENDEVYMLIDHDNENQAINIDKKILLTAHFVAKENQKAVLKYSVCERDITVECESTNIVEKAKTSPLSKEDITLSLSKMGNDIFKVKNCKLDIDNIFIAKSELNELRRRAISLLIKTMLEAYDEKYDVKKFVPYQFHEENISKHKLNVTTRQVMIQITSLKQLNTDIINKVHKIIFKPQEYNESVFKEIKSYVQKNKLRDKFLIYIPPVLTCNDFNKITTLLETFYSVGLYVNNISGLYFAFNGYEITAGPLLNIYNRYAGRFLELYNVRDIALSLEISEEKANEINDNSSQDMFFFAYGYFPHMTLEHCPFKELNSTCENCKYYTSLTLTNANKEEFYYNRNKIVNCHFELVNSKPINYIDKLKEYPKLNALLVFEKESAQDIFNLIKNL